MIVYRMEHMECPRNARHHGPHGTDSVSCPIWEAPNFGSNGPIPQEEGLPMDSTMRCGVLRNQVPLWWTTEGGRRPVPGWAFGVYYLHRHADLVGHLFVGKFQVTFKPCKALFLGYFRGWADENWGIDDRYPDSFFERKALRKLESRTVMSRSAFEPSFDPNTVHPLRTETLGGSHSPGGRGFDDGLGSWVDPSDPRCFREEPDHESLLAGFEPSAVCDGEAVGLRP